MELVVHGTKQGYKSSFIPNIQPSFSLGDIRNGVNNENPLGKSVYSIAFSNGSCIFTKYTIIRDTLRSYAIGTIAFSLYLSANKELSGKGQDVKTLLDKLMNKYIDEYVRDNNINRGETTLIQEDWSFVDTISNGYREQDKTRKEEEILSGTADPAFIYYKSDSELQEYFDKPFQEEYSNYRQILFIDDDLQGITNPRNVLKNSGIELKDIDLKNEYYYLNNYNHSKGVSITANGKLRSDGKNNNVIRAKCLVEIKYSKDSRCYKPINAHGTLSDTTSEIYKYLETKGNQIILKYDAFNNPTPIKKTVTFEIKDRNGEAVEDVEITCKADYQQEQKITGNTTSFIGEDIIKRWTISAKKGDSYASDEVPFSPETQEIVPIPIPMHNIKKVEVTAKIENRPVSDFTIHIPDYGIIDQQNNFVEFRDETINKKCSIKVTKSEGQDYYSGSYEFTPKDKSTIPVQLTKEPRKQAPPSETGKSEKDSTKNEKSKLFFDKITPKMWSLISVSTLVLALGIYVLCHFLGGKQSGENLLTDKQIINYVESDLLFIEKLNAYKSQWEHQKNDFIKKSGGGTFGGDEKADSTKLKSIWQPVYESIDRAIHKRNLINNKDFAELLNLRYSEQQQSFKIAIEKINSTKYEEVGQQLGDVSALTLTQIAEQIDDLTPKPEEGEPHEEEPKILENRQKSQEIKPITTATEDNNTKTVEEDLQKATITKQKLKEYREAKFSKLKESISLYEKFWEKVSSSKQKKDFDDLLKQVKKDNILKNSELKMFLDSICANSASFGKFNSASGKAACESLNELKEKLK